MQQLPLLTPQPAPARFANYLAGDNGPLVACLQGLLRSNSEPQVLIVSSKPWGKTHLLQALGHDAAATGFRTAYLPMKQLSLRAPELLEGMEMMDLVCIDDIHLLFGRRDWEEALFYLINGCRAHLTVLVMSSAVYPSPDSVDLPDLRSRLLWGPVFRLKPLDDAQLLASLLSEGRARGLTLDNAIAKFLLERSERDLPSLMRTLDVLDEASLAQQRRLTVPFVKDVLGF